MESQNGGSDLQDPLEGYSGLSLFPRTLASLPNPPMPYDPHDLNHTHNFLKSMPLQSPNKLLEQAKVIVDGSSELLNLKMTSNVASNNEDEDMENPRKRRPGLGIKRARARPRFSLKPNSSQPTVSLEPTLDIAKLKEPTVDISKLKEPTLDIAKLKDPEELFAAFERVENAKREIQRQTGGVMELDQNNLFNAPLPRPRRAGELGRTRTVKYRHLYPISVSSQDIFEEYSFSPLDQSSQQEMINPNVASEERDLTGSITRSEKRVSELLDELLAKDYEELDGDGAVTLLQDRLQIKPLDLEKFCLPELKNIPRIDLKASGEQSRKPRNALADIHNMFKGIRSSKTPLNHINAETLASPTPPKSPFASISLLKKRILQSNPLSDPFSAHDIDQSLARNASPIESINQQSDQVDTGKELRISKELKSLMIDDIDVAVANMSSPEVAVGDFAGPSDKSVNDNSSRLGSGVDVGSSGSHADMQDNNGDSSMDHRVVNENLSRPDPDADVQTSGPNELDDKVEDMLQEAVASAQPDINMEDSTAENLDSIRSQLADQSGPAATEDNAMDGRSNTADNDSEQHNEKIQESSRVPLNERSKAIRPHKKHKREGRSRRQSLAASGTSWESGVRRSTRIRSRPLEYWKGERFLYGRIHESLATVIGIKYESPAKDVGKPTLKVKSFISDEYKELVERVGLH